MTLLLLAATVGVTLIIVRGTIFSAVRALWPAFFGCSQCVGAWVGAAAGATAVFPAGHGRVLDAAIVGAATSLTAMSLDILLLKLGAGPADGEAKP